MKNALLLAPQYGFKRAYRRLTIPFRLKPNFIIVGVQKGGTTSLFNYLAQHPRIKLPQEKEPGFFGHKYHQGMNWYQSLFPAVWSSIDREIFITGEASTDYIFNPHAPRRVAEILPEVKIIALLRNPVERAYSHYHHVVRLKREPLSFEAAIAKEEERVGPIIQRMKTDENYYHIGFNSYSYLSRGIYVDQLQAWFEWFDREQILILRSEDLQTDLPNLYQKVLDFLELPPWQLKLIQKYNCGHYQPMNPATRQYLVEYFSPHNERLYEYLGVDFHWQ